MARNEYSIVYVPTDTQKPLEEWKLPLPEDKEAQLGCLTDRLRKHFAEHSKGDKSSDEQQEIFKQQLMSQMPKGAQMNDQMLQMMLQMESLVDSIPLQINSKDVGYIGVNMYVDDKGTSKGLPSNQRASAIAQGCGKMLEVRGDAFIARVHDDDDAFDRLDFNLSEVSMEAEWVKTAQEQSKAGTSSASKPVSLPKPSASPQTTTQRVCAAPNCSAPGVSRCARCKNEYYCSVACQKSHWKTHKQDCRKAA